MAYSTRSNTLYAATRAEPLRLFALRVMPSGELDVIGVTPLPDSMVNIQLDLSERRLLTASYGGNSLSVLALEDDGKALVTPLHHAASGASKPHAMRFLEDNRHVYVPHLGSDQIHAYVFDAQQGTLEAEPSEMLSVAAGTGPRHLVMSPDNRFLYVLGEFRGTITVYERTDTSNQAWDKSVGRFAQIQCVSSLPADTDLQPGAARAPSGGANPAPTPEVDVSRAVFCADIQLTPNGRFLFSSERTDSTLSCFSVDPLTGHLTLMNLTPTETQPRSFAIDSRGHFMVAAGQQSNTVSLYTIGEETGALTLVDQGDVGNDANWVTLVDLAG